MDIMNLQNFLASQAPLPASAEKNRAAVRQPQQKADSFASKLNNAVERSANGASTKENSQLPADTEKPMVFNNENNMINETRPKQAAEDSRTDIADTTATGGDQPLVNEIPEIPDEFLIAASLVSQMPPAVNIPGENIAVQLGTLQAQGNFFLGLSERPGLSLAVEDLTGLSPDADAETETLENLLSGANAQNKGQTVSQAAADGLNEHLTDAKQNPDGLATKGELPKAAETESVVVLQQPNGNAKQPQTSFQPINPADELAKPEAEPLKQTADADIVKQTVDADAVKQTVNADTAKQTVNADVAKQAADVNAVKQATDADVVKPAVEIAKLTVIDAAKPALEIAKPNGQPVTEETAGLTIKEPAEQNSANRQDTAGQQSFNQTMASTAEQIKNPDQSVNNNHTFAIPLDTAAQSTADKPGAAQTQQTQPDFAAPRDEFEIKAQIVQQATLINRSAQESEMIIRLKPEHLGDMTLKVTVNNGVVNASFHSNNAEVRGALENSLQQLKNDLANAGFKVDNVSISAGLSQFTADQERAMQWQQQTRHGSGKNGEEGYADAAESVTVSQQVVNASKDAGVDYRI